jgi:hypothetical protein
MEVLMEWVVRSVVAPSADRFAEQFELLLNEMAKGGYSLHLTREGVQSTGELWGVYTFSRVLELVPEFGQPVHQSAAVPSDPKCTGSIMPDTLSLPGESLETLLELSGYAKPEHKVIYHVIKDGSEMAYPMKSLRDAVVQADSDKNADRTQPYYIELSTTKKFDFVAMLRMHSLIPQ